MEIWNLMERKARPEIQKYIENNGYHKNKHPKFSIGQQITFWTGYNDDIRAKSIITGFNNDGGIYVYCDCYWFPIKDNSRYDIKE